ncbi:hypothetical protein, partial [Pseudoalteromonas sp. S4492]|uniref:hypothetical protein n=1 Tax=Pseudoalteromonas sp. S4492 TaxID=579560 RepID=UPI001BB22E6B
MKELFRCRKNPEAIYQLLIQVTGLQSPEGWEMRDYFQGLIRSHRGAGIDLSSQSMFRQIAQA